MTNLEREKRQLLEKIEGKNMKHTPGPWKYELVKRDKTWPAKYQINTDILTFGMDTEEGIYTDNPNDAALMFAAPELLEALKFLADTLDGEEGLAPDVQQCIYTAKALIAKAEGR